MICLILKFKIWLMCIFKLVIYDRVQLKQTCPEHDGAPVAIPGPAWSLLRHLFSVSHIQVTTTWSPVVILQMVHNTWTCTNIVRYTSTCVLRRKECFVQSLVEIGSLVLDRKIFIFHLWMLAISLLSSLGKGHSPSFEQTWIPSTQGSLITCIYNWPCGFRRQI